MPPKSKTEALYKCTSCNSKIKTAYDAFLHPLLKVLVCRGCHTSYGTGDFSVFDEGVDQNGEDNYCRWCVDGGDLYTCGNADRPEPNKCHYAYCTDCIERNCPEDDVLSLDKLLPGSNWRWNCFACDTNKLKRLRQEAQNAILALSQRDLRRNHPVVTAEKAPATTTNGDRREEVSASAAKKRKLDNGSVSSDVPESSAKEVSKDAPSRESARETGKEPTKEPSRESNRDLSKDSNKDSAKGLVREKSKESVRDTNKESAKDSAKDLAREPEACLMPPLEKPKQPKTSLRQLQTPGSSLVKPSNTSSPSDLRAQKPTRERPIPSKTISSSSGSKSLPSSTKSIDAQARQKQNSTVLVNSDDNSNRVPPKVSSQPPFPKLRPTSKQLKPNNEQITPSTKVQLSASDLKKRLEIYGTVKDKCIKEIDTKFQSILEMFATKDIDTRIILKSEIEELDQPLREFNTMLLNLKSLYHSQN